MLQSKSCYFRTKETIQRKQNEANRKKQEAAQKRREAASARDSARRKQREEEKYDQKAEHTTRHAEKLRRDREAVLQKIASKRFIYLNDFVLLSILNPYLPGQHRAVDVCTQEMSKSACLLLVTIGKLLYLLLSVSIYRFVYSTNDITAFIYLLMIKMGQFKHFFFHGICKLNYVLVSQKNAAPYFYWNALYYFQKYLSVPLCRSK